MIVDIFSSFDPYINIIYYATPFLFWGLRVFRFLFIRGSFWVSPGSLTLSISYFMDGMATQSTRTFLFHIKGFRSILISLFVIFIIINFLGLLPYRFSFSRHMVFSFIFGLPLWFSLIISSFINSPKAFMARLLPRGAPNWLNPFLVVVETVRTVVRPGTISVRLAANIRAGHIVLTLIGIYCSSYFFNSFLVFVIILLRQIFYLIFEVGICVIQAYIFSLLLRLYSEDHSSNSL